MKRVKFGVTGHFLENTWREWPEILHADVSWPPSELIILWPQSVDFCNFGTILTVKQVKFGVSRHFLENSCREWPEIWYAAVSWPPSEVISLWPRSVDFSNFGAILTKWNGSNLGFPGIFWRTHGGNGLKLCTLMYRDHVQNWLVYGHGLLIFLILALFWLSETGQIWGFQAFSGEPMEEMAWNFARGCIVTTFRTD